MWDLRLPGALWFSWTHYSQIHLLLRIDAGRVRLYFLHQHQEKFLLVCTGWVAVKRLWLGRSVSFADSICLALDPQRRELCLSISHAKAHNLGRLDCSNCCSWKWNKRKLLFCVISETELSNTHIDVLILHLQLIYSVLAVYIFSECSV